MYFLMDHLDKPHIVIEDILKNKAKFLKVLVESYGIQQQDADLILSDAVIRIYGQWTKKGKSIDDPNAYFSTILRRMAIMHLRSQKQHLSLATNLHLLNNPLVEQELQFQKQEACERILSLMSTSCQDIFKLILKGYKIHEIAKQQQKLPNTISVQSKRCLQYSKKRLQQEGICQWIDLI